ncbi:MAG: 2-oxoglutarate dehydrogenase E1 component, partial [Candidatus Eremiobacteraeota bacterium]|nr:2-oxoglutarate dehydrogenase E1 component [Candidatus Eremiobacteraeota bacterium]
DLVNDPDFGKMQHTAVVRVELLSPLPRKQILTTIESYPNTKRIVWVQEEPKNMGARAHVRRRLLERLPKKFDDIEYIGRPYRSSPSEGYPGAHAAEQERIIKEALSE